MVLLKEVKEVVFSSEHSWFCILRPGRRLQKTLTLEVKSVTKCC